MITTTLNFDAIINEDRGLFDDVQCEVLAHLQETLNTAEGPTGRDKVSQFVAYLTSYSPAKFEKAGYTLGSFVWYMWKVFTSAAACIPPDHAAQDVLVQVLLALRAAEAPWKDLHNFEMFIGDEWTESHVRGRRPAPAINQPELSLDKWLNLNAFVARLYRDVDTSFRTFGIWELCHGLEGDATKDDEGKPLPQASVDTRVRVAAEWIIRAGDRLWKDSLLGVWAEDTGTRAYIGGKLIPATRGLNLERWGFWKRRFAEVRDVVRDQAAGDAVGQALEVMKALEKKAAEAL